MGNSPRPEIESLEISVSGVTKQLCELKTNKACGPDAYAIPAWVLKEYAKEISPFLTDTYQCSIDTGIVPSKWKNANVCGVIKRGKIRPDQL